MKRHKIETVLPPKLLREFENFYDSAQGTYMGRRLRDMFVEFSKTSSAKEDIWVRSMLSDMYVWFSLIDACEDAYADKLGERRRIEERADEFEP